VRRTCACTHAGTHCALWVRREIEREWRKDKDTHYGLHDVMQMDLNAGLNHVFYAMIKKQDIVTEEVWEREWKERE